MLEVINVVGSILLIVIGIALAVWMQIYLVRLIWALFNNEGDGGLPAPKPEPVYVRALPARRTLAPVYKALLGV